MPLLCPGSTFGLTVIGTDGGGLWIGRRPVVKREATPAGRKPHLACLLTIGVVGRRTGADWLPTFEFGLANDSSCLRRPVRVSGAEGQFTLKLDARQSSSRWQPPALNVDRPTAAFEASELSLSTLTRHRRFSGRLPVYLANCRSLSSSSKSEFVKTGHSRISTGDVDKIPAERPLSKMQPRAHDQSGPPSG